MKHLVLSGVAAVALILPDAVSAQHPTAAPTGGQLHLSLHYDGKLLVKVFDMQVEQTATATTHSSTSRFQSYGILAAFKRLDMRATSAGRIVGGDPRPGAFSSKNYGSKSKRQVNVTWGRDDVSVTANPAYFNLGEPPASKPQKLAAADPLTQLMRLTLNGSRAHACSRTVRFFDGKQLYDLNFSNPRSVAAGAREKRLGLVNGVRCDVRFQEVAGFKAKPASERDQGLKHGITLDFGQVGQGGPWVLSSLRASTPLGRGAVELSSVTVTGRDPTG